MKFRNIFATIALAIVLCASAFADGDVPNGGYKPCDPNTETCPPCEEGQTRYCTPVNGNARSADPGETDLATTLLTGLAELVIRTR